MANKTEYYERMAKVIEDNMSVSDGFGWESDTRVGIVSSNVSALVVRDKDELALMRIPLFKDDCSPTVDYMSWNEDSNIQYIVEVGTAACTDNALVTIHRTNDDIVNNFRAYIIKPDGTVDIFGRSDGEKISGATISWESFFEKFESMDFTKLYSVEEMTSSVQK